MSTELQIINQGISDDIEILNDFEMCEIIGGADLLCKKGYMISSTGIVECECGYKLVVDTPPPPGNGNVGKPDEPIKDGTVQC